VTKRKSMTLTQFLRRLRKTPRDWVFLPSLVIRRRLNGDVFACPISQLEELWSPSAKFVALNLGLSGQLTHDIIMAADNSHAKRLRGLRLKIERACGLRKARK
jgi:hypothetical protein